MNISFHDLQQAVQQKILTQEQADALWTMWIQNSNNQRSLSPIHSKESGFTLANVIYYLGACIVLIAMSWLGALGQELLGPYGLFIISSLYACLFAVLGWRLWSHGSKISGGLLCTLAVCMTPLIVYGLQVGMGLWPDEQIVDENVHNQAFNALQRDRIIIEVSTILVALVALYKVRFPFLTAPLAIALWCVVLDVVSLLSVANKSTEWASVVSGLVMLISAYLVDRRTKQDFAFWLYLFGLCALSSGLMALMLFESHPLTKFMYALIHILFLLVAVILNRSVFVIFGAFGLFAYLCYLSYEVFQDSILFPLILSLFGLGIIYLGILYQRHQSTIQEKLLTFVPDSFKRQLPQMRENPASEEERE